MGTNRRASAATTAWVAHRSCRGRIRHIRGGEFMQHMLWRTSWTPSGAQAGKPWPRVDRRNRYHQQYEGRYCLMPSQCDKLYHTLPARLTESDFAMPSCLVYEKKRGPFGIGEPTTTYHPRLQLDYYPGPCPRRRQILQGVSAEVSFRLPLW